MGFEPMTSCLRDRRSNHLSHDATYAYYFTSHSVSFLDLGTSVVTTPTLKASARKRASFSKNAATLSLLLPQANIVPRKSIKKTHLKRHRAKKPTESFTFTYHPQNLAVKNVILKKLSSTTTHFIQTAQKHR